jgi:predicted SprT family Zn-dependent metalloprotease
MNNQEIIKYAKEKLKQHNLNDWSFKFSHGKTTLGVCRYNKKEINFSKHFTNISPEKIKDTILHEIAHALTPGSGHGLLWQAACRRIGAKPERTAKQSEVGKLPEHNYFLVYPDKNKKQVEICCRYYKKPHQKIKKAAFLSVVGRRETLGKLIVVKKDELNLWKKNGWEVK